MASLGYTSTFRRSIQRSVARLSTKTTVSSGGRNEYHDFALLDKTFR